MVRSRCRVLRLRLGMLRSAVQRAAVDRTDFVERHGQPASTRREAAGLRPGRTRVSANQRARRARRPVPPETDLSETAVRLTCLDSDWVTMNHANGEADLSHFFSEL